LMRDPDHLFNIDHIHREGRPEPLTPPLLFLCILQLKDQLKEGDRTFPEIFPVKPPPDLSLELLDRPPCPFREIVFTTESIIVISHLLIFWVPGKVKVFRFHTEKNRGIKQCPARYAEIELLSPFEF